MFIEIISNIDNYTIGIDASKNMIKIAKRKYAAQNLICADADHLPFLTKTFDIIFSFTLLQNMPNPRLTILELHRVAKSGSKIAITTLKKTFKRLSFQQLLNENGLKVIKFIDEENIKDFIAICKIL